MFSYNQDYNISDSNALLHVYEAGRLSVQGGVVSDRVLICVFNQVGQVGLGQDLLGAQIMPFADVIL